MYQDGQLIATESSLSHLATLLATVSVFIERFALARKIRGARVPFHILQLWQQATELQVLCGIDPDCGVDLDSWAA